MFRRISFLAAIGSGLLAGACDRAPTAVSDAQLTASAAVDRAHSAGGRDPRNVGPKFGRPVRRSRAFGGRAAFEDQSAIIGNGTVQLGVWAQGHLNVPGGTPSSVDGTTLVGLRYMPTNGEGTAPGCACEGWGASAQFGDGAVRGFANESSDGGVNNLDVESFTSTDSTALSIVMIPATAPCGDSGEGDGAEACESRGSAYGDAERLEPVLRVSHSYRPIRSTRFLYEVTVAIENVSSRRIEDVRYRRVMDWDIPPTTFDEYVTIQGTEGASRVLHASNGGFSSADPLASRDNDEIFVRDSIVTDPETGATSSEEVYDDAIGDFVDLGPDDHGALFDFGFGGLDPTERVIFKIYYGAAPSETLARGALSNVGAEIYSFGQAGWEGKGSPTARPASADYCSRSVDDLRFPRSGPFTPMLTPYRCFGAETGQPATFIFAFGGVGGGRLDNLKPEANAGGPYLSVPEGTPFNFDGSRSIDPEAFPLSFDWQWGDGTPNSAGGRPAHVYAQNGRYDIRLIVTDRGGLKDTIATTVTVVNVPPFLRAPTGIPSVHRVGAPLFVTWAWDDKGRGDGPWRINIEWGDGTSTTGTVSTQSPIAASHVWRRKDKFRVRLTITDKDGGAGTVAADVNVR